MRLGVARPLEKVAVLSVLGIFAYYMMQWGLEGVIHNRATQTVPDLRSRSLGEALTILAPLNLGLRKDASEYDASVPVQAILRQNPLAGTVVREGKVVRVVISQGGETVFVPGLVGLPLRNAGMLLRQSQLSLGEVAESYSLRIEKGQVMSQDPKAESSVERNSMISVSVSAGEPPAGVTLMPDFLRKDVSELEAWAASQGLQISVSKDAGSLFPAGTILSQVPAPDTVLPTDRKEAVAAVVSGRAAGAGPGSAGAKTFHYEVSQGGAESLVRIVVADKYGERELFNGLRRPGSKIDIPLQETGGARVKIFLNGILVEERDL